MPHKIDISNHRIIVVNTKMSDYSPIDMEGIVLSLTLSGSNNRELRDHIIKMVNEDNIEYMMADSYLSGKINLRVRWSNDIKSSVSPRNLLIRSKVVICENIWGHNDNTMLNLRNMIDTRPHHELNPKSKRNYGSLISRLSSTAILGIKECPNECPPDMAIRISGEFKDVTIDTELEPLISWSKEPTAFISNIDSIDTPNHNDLCNEEEIEQQVDLYERLHERPPVYTYTMVGNTYTTYSSGGGGAGNWNPSSST